MSAGKIVIAVLAGALSWAVLWVSGTMVLAAVWPAHVTANKAVNDPAALVGYIAWSVILSVLAGYICARIAGFSAASRAVTILAGLQLVLGTIIEVSAWSLSPAWYHVVFLILLVPTTVYGGRLHKARN